MEWQPIETAPTDQMVRLGKWDVFMGKIDWRDTAGVAFETRLFGRKRTYYGQEYSHWRPLPPPPSPINQEQGRGEG